MLAGLPTSGKSTYVNQLRKSSYWRSAVVLSTDNYLDRIAKEHNSSYNEVFDAYIDEATKQLNIELQDALSLKKPIIHDQTNLTIKTRAKKLRRIPKSYKKILVYFEHNMEEVLKRNENRPGKYISESVLRRMQLTYELPTTNEGFDLVLSPDQELSI